MERAPRKTHASYKAQGLVRSCPDWCCRPEGQNLKAGERCQAVMLMVGRYGFGKCAGLERRSRWEITTDASRHMKAVSCTGTPVTHPLCTAPGAEQCSMKAGFTVRFSPEIFGGMTYKGCAACTCLPWHSDKTLPWWH